MTAVPARERQRRRRARRQRGERIAHIPYNLVIVEWLVDMGALQWHESNDSACIEAALASAIQALADRDA